MPLTSELYNRPMLDKRTCQVGTAAELDAEIRDIFALDLVGRGDQISGTLHIEYTDESVKQAKLLSQLEGRGVTIEWHKKS